MTKILVIDDEPSVKENILDMLDAEGFETIEAENGHVGITLAWEYKPDLIICDVKMPELDGYENAEFSTRRASNGTHPFYFSID
jgi:YesN/AraC family two-component response regulator